MDRRLESLSGLGTLKRADGTMIGRRRYHIEVSQQMHFASGGGEQVPGLRRITGRIELEGYEGITYVSEKAALVLTIEDGRSLPFSFSSSAGHIAHRGDLK